MRDRASLGRDDDPIEPDDPFAAGDGRGYRAGAKLTSERRAGGAWWAALAGLGLVGAVALAAFRPLDRTTPIPSPTVAATETGPPPTRVAEGPAPTPLPAFQVVMADRTPMPFPVSAGGLRWVDTSTGIVGSDPFRSPRGWFFVDRDGSAICACLESPWSATEAIEAVALEKLDPHGRLVTRRDAARLESPVRAQQSIVRDIVLSRDRQNLYIGYAVRQSDRWDLGVTFVPTTGGEGGVSETSLRLSALTDPLALRGTVVPTIRISPDGATLRFTIRWRPRDVIAPKETQWRERAWTISAAPLAIEREDAERDTTDPDRCDGEGWVGLNYAIVCRRTAVDSIQPVVRVLDGDSPAREIAVGSATGVDYVDWLADVSSGVLYRWSPFSHEMSRLSLVSGDLLDRSLGEMPSGGSERTPEAPFPPAAAPVSWSRLGDALGFGPGPRLVGSPDGTLLYAIGLRPASAGDPADPSGPELASTGIWVFDAATLRLVAHWAAAARYDEIGLTPDGEDVVAVGAAGLTAAGTSAPWGVSMVIHDAREGFVREVIGDVVGEDGFLPVLLLPGGG